MDDSSPETIQLPGQVGDEWLGRAVLDACPEAIIVADVTGRILEANAAAARRWARPANDLFGASLWSLHPAGQAAHHKTVTSKALSSGLPIQFTERQGERWDEVVICPIGRASGPAEYIAVYTRDVTRQIRAEERHKLTRLQLLTIQEDERRRIAQDLHDDLGQAMTALILNLKAIQGEVVAGRVNVGEQVRQTIHTVEDMMRHIRQVFYGLRPPSFAASPLAKVLEALCTSLALTTGLRVVFSSQP